MNGKIYFSPISNPKRILDIGTGTGIWAMEMGRETIDVASPMANDIQVTSFPRLTYVIRSS